MHVAAVHVAAVHVGSVQQGAIKAISQRGCIEYLTIST